MLYIFTTNKNLKKNYFFIQFTSWTQFPSPPLLPVPPSISSLFPPPDPLLHFCLGKGRSPMGTIKTWHTKLQQPPRRVLWLCKATQYNVSFGELHSSNNNTKGPDSGATIIAKRRRGVRGTWLESPERKRTHRRIASHSDKWGRQTVPNLGACREPSIMLMFARKFETAGPIPQFSSAQCKCPSHWLFYMENVTYLTHLYEFYLNTHFNFSILHILSRQLLR